MASSDLQWQLTKKSNAYIVKQQQVPLIFSREAGNIAAIHQRKYSTVTSNAVGVAPAKDGKGVVLSIKNNKASSQEVAGQFERKTLTGGPRKVAGIVAKEVSEIRPDLYRPAVTKAQGIFRAQNGGVAPRPPRKVRGTKKPVVAVEESA